MHSMDQATGLRRIAQSDALEKRQTRAASKNRSFPRVIAITSGKGGVGKTNLVGNLAVAMARQGKRVIVIDADVGLANIDIIFNIRPEYSIRHVVNAEKSLDQVMVKTLHGIHIIPGGSGFSDLTQMNDTEKLNLLTAFETLENKADIILVDTGAGISSNILYFNAAADECVVIATREPTSITDAYALMKVMSRDHGTRHFKLVVNMVENEKEAKTVYGSLSGALERFLKNVVLEYTGYIPFDRALQKAVQKKDLVMDSAPGSPAAAAIETISRKLLQSAGPGSDGNLTFFMNRMFQAGV